MIGMQDSAWKSAMQTIDIGTLIIRSPEVLGGRPHITGTRVSVQRIAAWYKMGLNAEEISERMGNLKLAQVYAALTYYHANQSEIEEYLMAEKLNYEQLSGMRQQSL